MKGLHRKFAWMLLVFWLCGLAFASQGSPVPQCTPTATVVLSGIQGAGGSTVGPDGALYVTEGVTGSILRVDPVTGASTTFATGLPVQLPAGRGFGGPVDVVFIDGTAYALAALVGPILEGDPDAPAGIYRIDGSTDVTLLANIAGFNKANPPDTEFYLPIGVQYALETYRGDLLVTDGHLNRVLRVTTSGEISVMEAFGNVVPTGMDVRWNTIFMAQAGPIPYLPETGKVALFNELTEPSEVASGARLNVDAELGSGDSAASVTLLWLWVNSRRHPPLPSGPRDGRQNAFAGAHAPRRARHLPPSLAFGPRGAREAPRSRVATSIDSCRN